MADPTEDRPDPKTEATNPTHDTAEHYQKVLTEDDLNENIRRCTVTPRAVSTSGTTKGDVPQFRSMTRTTARRMSRGDQ